MRVFYWVWGILFLYACSSPSPLPDMQPGESGRVVRVLDGDALVLDTGLSVRLVGIEAPVLRPWNGDPEPYSVEAARTLEDMALGRRVQLFYAGLTRDRYDRALAHVVTDDASGPKLWLNMALIEQGAARVRLYPDTAARGAQLLEAERIARDASEGLWKKSAYRIVDAATLGEDARGFMIVEAQLGEALPPTGDFASRLACQRPLRANTFRLEVRKAASTACGLPVNTKVQLRGWVSNGRIDLTYPRHVIILEDD